MEVTFIENINGIYTVRTYNPEQHKEKVRFFIFHQSKDEQKLICGDRVNHLFLIYRAQDLGLLHYDSIESLTPAGAGKCFNGSITQWSSVGLSVSTPDILRPLIQEALSMRIFLNHF